MDNLANMPEINMNVPQSQPPALPQTQGKTRSTGGRRANKRYKRTPEELLEDIQQVDALVASGKYNQIEALQKVNVQSSVYHLKKRQMRAEPAHSNKPRKFAPRPNRRKVVQAAAKKRGRPAKTVDDFETKKAALIRQVEESKALKQTENFDEMQKELVALREKFDKLTAYVVDNVILNQH